jgi:lipoprotein-anchoring transpeptidase ErfK/SrfK
MNDRIVVVDRDAFRLRVYAWSERRNRFRREATYRIAVGAVGYATPEGPYVVTGRSREPDWLAPSWADPDVAGKVIPFQDPRNPFAGGFVSLGGHPSTDGDGVGFHGTRFDPQLGTRASHGCVRMDVDDLLDLWDRVPVGTNVYVD